MHRTGHTAFAVSPNGWRHTIGKPCGLTGDVYVDVLRILFSNAAIGESDEEKPGIILDFDKIGNIVGMKGTMKGTGSALEKGQN